MTAQAKSAAAFQQIAETGAAQARDAYEKAVAGTERSAQVAKDALATAAEGAKAVNAKPLSQARTNANAAFDYLEALLQVTSPTQLVEVSTEHARRQVETLKGQVQELAGVAEKATAQVVEPLIRANQMYVDRFLLEQVRLHPRITLRFGWQVSSVEQGAESVTLRAESIEGRTETWTAAYVIGCDGGHSMVRRTLGISYSGKSAENPAFMAGSMISAHVRIQGAYTSVLRGREGWLYNVLNPKQRLLLFSLDGKDDFLMMTNTVTGALMDNTQLREYILSATGADLPVTIVGQQTWTG